jgi:hypothetical protein
MVCAGGALCNVCATPEVAALSYSPQCRAASGRCLEALRKDTARAETDTKALPLGIAVILRLALL